MADVFELLPTPVEGQQAFIFDHGKEVDGKLKYQDDATSYGWSTKQFNKVEVGAFVLNRHPGKLMADRKFEIYGGGYVESITPIDDNGNVVAKISHAFVIDPPIKQGDSFLENFQWESKNKKEGTWEHFWNQYGMNTISFEDFKNLMVNARCELIDSSSKAEKESDLSDDDIKELETNAASGFTVTFVDEGLMHKKLNTKYTGVARKVDFKKIQASKDRIGQIGEEVIMDVLIERAKKEGLKAPVHVSKEEGDGAGYDIRCWDADGNEEHVEVKATTDKYSDGFEMSRNEIEASKDPNYKYYIYRVYNLDPKTRKCLTKVYEGPVTEDKFNLVSTKVAVYQK